MTATASSSTNIQAAAALDPLSCVFSGQSGHFIAQCLVCKDYITNRKSGGKDCTSQWTVYSMQHSWLVYQRPNQQIAQV
jgi:hypothetical protein